MIIKTNKTSNEDIGLWIEKKLDWKGKINDDLDFAGGNGESEGGGKWREGINVINETPLLSFTQTPEAHLNTEPNLVRSRCWVMKECPQWSTARAVLGAGCLKERGWGRAWGWGDLWGIEVHLSPGWDAGIRDVRECLDCVGGCKFGVLGTS